MPLGLVQNLEINDIGEVVAVNIRKSNGETIRRHTTDLIFLAKGDSSDNSINENSGSKTKVKFVRPLRTAARRARDSIKNLFHKNLV